MPIFGQSVLVTLPWTHWIDNYDVSITGAGRAGLSAAVYAASEGLELVPSNPGRFNPEQQEKPGTPVGNRPQFRWQTPK